ncbi:MULTISPECIES: DUF1573 domain-containing protein [Altibacter]|uniref:DUF1573 domain-containing protein n=1 Tax=Altibacter TaxID=1535231 RepID=UPI00054D917F|nr:MULTISPECIES: DUF1573 domain-containing protein [Altibacter]MCW8980524.1 DUF1573 domain-containing protein [Altibacter sp.]MCW9037918.1 DUF1573 domain-containing protein [Altibacter sp.]
MKKLVLIAIVALVSFSAQAQAKISFKTDTIDYGEIAKGSDGVRVFEFTNTGNAPLIISDVKSSCGCTVPKKPDGPVAPGESSTIQVKYDTNRVGPIRKTVTVYSNADEPIKALKIKGEVLDEGKSVLEKTE